MLSGESAKPEIDRSVEPESKLGEVIAALQADLATERDRRLQERFVWLLILIIAADAFIFAHTATWTGPVALTVLQLVLLVVVGRLCGVEDISQLVTNMLRRAGDKVAGNQPE